MTVKVTNGEAGELYDHLFKRPDGAQVLFIYDKEASPTVSVSLKTRGSQAYRYQLDGSSTLYPACDGRSLQNVSLSSGQVTVFRIDP